VSGGRKGRRRLELCCGMSCIVSLCFAYRLNIDKEKAFHLWTLADGSAFCPPSFFLRRFRSSEESSKPRYHPHGSEGRTTTTSPEKG
jgi:hypothetical protein